MKYLKVTQYIYLGFSLFFLHDAYTKFQEGEDYWLSIIIALVALGMFFFRRKFYKKQQNR